MNNNRIFIPIFCLFLGFLQTNTKLYGGQTILAGEAEFPKEYYDKWLAAQHDPSLSEEAKVKSTIDTYFILKYESWKTGKLLDFGFLFDLANIRAFEDYAYERGIHLVFLTSQSYRKRLLVRYDYQPRYGKINIEDQSSEVQVWPFAEIGRNNVGRIETTPWANHDLSLIKLGGTWLIRSLFTDDERHDITPRGTDFNEKARLLPIREKAREEAPYMLLFKIFEEPRFEALKKRLFGANTDRNVSNTTMEEIRDRFYGEIAGDYLLDSGKGGAKITFTPGDQYPRFLSAILKNGFFALTPDPRPDGEDPTVFSGRVLEEHRWYMLIFFWDETGRITKFEMTDFLPHRYSQDYNGRKVIGVKETAVTGVVR
jgi:hypothetical protein